MKLVLIEAIINDLSLEEIAILYEIIINKDYDFVENLFPTKEDFKEFIEKYKGEN